MTGLSNNMEPISPTCHSAPNTLLGNDGNRTPLLLCKFRPLSLQLFILPWFRVLALNYSVGEMTEGV